MKRRSAFWRLVSGGFGLCVCRNFRFRSRIFIIVHQFRRTRASLSSLRSYPGGEDDNTTEVECTTVLRTGFRLVFSHLRGAPIRFLSLIEAQIGMGRPTMTSTRPLALSSNSPPWNLNYDVLPTRVMLWVIATKMQ